MKLWQIEGFKYDKLFSNSNAITTPNKAILVPNFFFFSFSFVFCFFFCFCFCFYSFFWFNVELCILTNSKVLVSNMTIVFSNFGLKIPRKDIFGAEFKVFSFWMRLCNSTNTRGLISNMTIVFWNSYLKIPKKTILVSKLKFFSFTSHTAFWKIPGYANFKPKITQIGYSQWKIWKFFHPGKFERL